MSASTVMALHPPSADSRPPAKAAKPSKIVILRVASEFLERLSPAPTAAKGKTPRTKSSGTPSSVTPSAPPVQSVESSAGQDDSESNSTPAPAIKEENGTAASGTTGPRRGGKPGPKPNPNKRTAPSGDSSGTPKPRGKPGPKKRIKVDADQNGDAAKGSSAGPIAAVAPKLGPKANQGAINAGLRALDRTGAKCRRWDRKSYELKSFTGVAWLMPQWSTPKLNKEKSFGEVKSDTTTTSNDSKADMRSSAAGSVSSGGEGAGHHDAASSPAALQSAAVSVA